MMYLKKKISCFCPSALLSYSEYLDRLSNQNSTFQQCKNYSIIELKYWNKIHGQEFFVLFHPRPYYFPAKLRSCSVPGNTLCFHKKKIHEDLPEYLSPVDCHQHIGILHCTGWIYTHNLCHLPFAARIGDNARCT